MHLFLKIKSSIGLVLGTFFSILLVLDAYEIGQNPTDYVKVYNISANSNHWEYQSIQNYQMKSLIFAGIALAYVGLSIFSLTTKSLNIKHTIFAIDIALVLWGIVNYFIWAATGYDHP